MKIPLDVFYIQQEKRKGGTASALIRETRTLSRRGRIALMFRVAASFTLELVLGGDIPCLRLNCFNVFEKVFCRSDVARGWK